MNLSSLRHYLLLHDDLCRNYRYIREEVDEDYNPEVIHLISRRAQTDRQTDGQTETIINIKEKKKQKRKRVVITNDVRQESKVTSSNNVFKPRHSFLYRELSHRGVCVYKHVGSKRLITLIVMLRFSCRSCGLISDKLVLMKIVTQVRQILSYK